MNNYCLLCAYKDVNYLLKIQAIYKKKYWDK